MIVNIYMELPSLSNARGHWSKIAKIKKRQRKIVQAALFGREKPELPVVITLVRFGSGTRPMDDDNLAGAFKAVRDEVAAWLQVDDGNKKKITWHYDQGRDTMPRIEIRW